MLHRIIVTLHLVSTYCLSAEDHMLLQSSHKMTIQDSLNEDVGLGDKDDMSSLTSAPSHRRRSCSGDKPCPTWGVCTDGGSDHDPCTPICQTSDGNFGCASDGMICHPAVNNICLWPDDWCAVRPELCRHPLTGWMKLKNKRSNKYVHMSSDSSENRLILSSSSSDGSEWDMQVSPNRGNQAGYGKVYVYLWSARKQAYMFARGTRDNQHDFVAWSSRNTNSDGSLRAATEWEVQFVQDDRDDLIFLKNMEYNQYLHCSSTHQDDGHHWVLQNSVSDGSKFFIQLLNGGEGLR